MRVLLVNPPFLPRKGKFSREQRSPAVTKSGTFYYPMWLAFGTGVLEKNGHECRLIDAPALGCDYQSMLADHIGGFSPDLIVIDTSTPSIRNDIEIGIKLKEHLQAKFLVAVGNHPSALPEETLAIDSRLDGVFRQEFEYPLLELANLLAQGGGGKSLKSVNGLSFRESGNITHNPPGDLPHDLDEIPFVSEVYRRHLNHRDYFYSHSKHPIVTMITGRGCPHKCIYCVYPQVFSSHKMRFRSIKNVVDEVEYVLKTFPDVQEIMFEDDTFTINKARSIEFAEEVIRRKLKFQWSANARAEVDLETMQMLKKAGARLFCVGIESGVQEILDNMKKRLSLERIRQFFSDAKKAGILIHGCFLVGNPGETKDTLNETLKFAKELNPDTAQFFPIMIYPGTAAYEWAKENNFLTTTEYSEWLNSEGMHNTIVSRPGLSNNELVEFCDRARKEFYLRPSYIVTKIIQGIKDPHEFKRLTIGATHLAKSILIPNKKDCGCS